MVVYKPDANFLFCRLPDDAPSGPEVARELFVEYNMYIKHCEGKNMPESDRYLRVASRTQAENTNFIAALENILALAKNPLSIH
jgi:histidinol-phosphate/aromatic aminotransferase/cobyric acid decarboxylase-like protein